MTFIRKHLKIKVEKGMVKPNGISYLKLFCFVLLLTLVILACKQNKRETESFMETENTQQHSNFFSKSIFGKMPDGSIVEKFTLINAQGMEVDVITYGGIITRWTAPDKNGQYQDVVLGFEDLESYVEGNPFFGALVGRYANRIAKGTFTLEGETYTLALNDGENHLHGGNKGFDKVVWKATPKVTKTGAVLELTYTSPDGEEGYPGNLEVKVTYALTPENALDIQYEASTDKPTIVNLTQHSYFNLSGDFSQSIEDHELVLHADAYLPVDDGLIPTGEIAPVAGTPFDFKQPKPIGKDIQLDNDQLKLGKGYDHCWVLNEREDGFGRIGYVHHPESGRFLEVYSNEPGVQLYSGNFLDGTFSGKKGNVFGKRAGFCLETQHFPDSPNQPSFPSVRLNPGETYFSRTLFKFSAKP
ncbi:aldose epimerase family protein [Flagellimonas beolgyonensis]|uniref:aldose epimerase family protein n=1 Tax=Flagellimonas beolgyonensis TaxID=864064 RepID=UPI001F49AAD1|nr:aldose epimerase family protein [Allomuricauda beolgyonensis]